MLERTDDPRADRRTDSATHDLMLDAKPAATERFRLQRLSDAMVTPWQLPAAGTLSDAAPFDESSRKATVTETEFLVEWQLGPSTP